MKKAEKPAEPVKRKPKQTEYLAVKGTNQDGVFLDESPKQEDPRDLKIKRMRDILIYLKDNVVHGSSVHVASIESVLRD